MSARLAADGAAPRRLAFAAAALATLAVAAAADLGSRDAGPEERAFHAVTGALGAGPAVHLQGCPAAFDARLPDACPDALEPVPGGRAACPVPSRASDRAGDDVHSSR